MIFKRTQTRSISADDLLQLWDEFPESRTFGELRLSFIEAAWPDTPVVESVELDGSDPPDAEWLDSWDGQTPRVRRALACLERLEVAVAADPDRYHHLLDEDESC